MQITLFRSETCKIQKFFLKCYWAALLRGQEVQSAWARDDLEGSVKIISHKTKKTDQPIIRPKTLL